MGVIGRAREIGRWVGTLGALRRGTRPGGRVDAAAGPGAPPRPAVRRPEDDPALRERLSRWRAPAPGADGSGPPPMTARERTAAMRDLEVLRSRLEGPQAAAIDAALADGSVTVRRLGPGDGHVWELPGMRVFAIVGVQAFTVDDAAP
jgi:hypothetical protein